MPHCQLSKDCSLAVHLCPSGTWVISCPTCLYTYTSTTKDYYLSRYMFWEHHDNLPKEIEMSQVTSDYRRGVEEATKPLEEYPTVLKLAFDEIMGHRRKSLLTKKVTKWYNLYSDGKKVTVGQRDLYDSKEWAESNSYDTVEKLSYIGAFPVETIVEL